MVQSTERKKETIKEDDLITKELRDTLKDEQAAFLISLSDAFKKGGSVAKDFQFLHPNLAELIKKLKHGQGLFLKIDGSFYELRQLPHGEPDPDRVFACIKMCDSPLPWRCCQ